MKVIVYERHEYDYDDIKNYIQLKVNNDDTDETEMEDFENNPESYVMDNIDEIYENVGTTWVETENVVVE